MVIIHTVKEKYTTPLRENISISDGMYKIENAFQEGNIFTPLLELTINPKHLVSIEVEDEKSDGISYA